MLSQLALDAQQLRLEIDHEGVTAAPRDRGEDFETRFDGSQPDSRLRDGSTLARRQVLHDPAPVLDDRLIGPGYGRKSHAWVSFVPSLCQVAAPVGAGSEPRRLIPRHELRHVEIIARAVVIAA